LLSRGVLHGAQDARRQNICQVLCNAELIAKSLTKQKLQCTPQLAAETCIS
jgi:hypothetical protein